jgi:aspartyl-tRNA(Asn)/glutamyl-tRNA(Gln) amidotransferase subunit C
MRCLLNTSNSAILNKMSKITRDHIIKLANLSKLRIDDKDIERYQKELSAILEYVERLDTVDTEGYSPIFQVSGLSNQFRKDSMKNVKLTTSGVVLMSSVPRTEDGYIKVGRMI